jgi:hypothetical protein
MAFGAILFWLIATSAFLIGTYLIGLNYYGWLYLGLMRKVHHSPIAVLGGVLCALSLFMLPLTRSWFWVPLVLDPGSVFLVGFFAYFVAVKRFK